VGIRPLTIAAAVLGAVSLAAGCGDNESTSTTETAGAGGGATLSGEIAGAGSSAQQAAQEAWISAFQQANSGVTIAYDPVGSGGGREAFIAGGKTVYAGSDSALADEELTGAQTRCGGPDNLVEIPDYVSPIAVAYNVSGVDSLKLSPDVLAKIFKGEVKKWNDPAIAAENSGVDLPDTDISPVHRSDESGTTDNFTDYLHQAAPDVWTDEHDSSWPLKSGEAAEGTSGVVDAIKNGDGSIGYADESQVGDLGKAEIKVGSEYVGPSAEAAAKIFADSQKSDDPGKNVFTYVLNRNTESSGTYPIVLVSYLMGCTTYDNPNDGKIAKAYFNYIISADGQQTANQAAGSAPIGDDVRTQIQPAVDAIGGA
jgi:phosphate transport system substrate-binding protein